MTGPRTFSLSFKGNIRYRLEYAVFLLNKNIEHIMVRQGLKVVDLRNTLPNLKYLLFVLSEGAGPVPDRQLPKSKSPLGSTPPLSPSLSDSFLEDTSNLTIKPRFGKFGSIDAARPGIATNGN
jgi:hypothetical protein